MVSSLYRSSCRCANFRLHRGTTLLISAKAAIHSGAGGSILRSDQPRTKRSASSAPSAPGRTKGKAAGHDAGNALRSAYQQTVDEAIPTEMLDLLNKLR